MKLAGCYYNSALNFQNKISFQNNCYSDLKQNFSNYSANSWFPLLNGSRINLVYFGSKKWRTEGKPKYTPEQIQQLKDKSREGHELWEKLPIALQCLSCSKNDDEAGSNPLERLKKMLTEDGLSSDLIDKIFEKNDNSYRELIKQKQTRLSEHFYKKQFTYRGFDNHEASDSAFEKENEPFPGYYSLIKKSLESKNISIPDLFVLINTISNINGNGKDLKAVLSDYKEFFDHFMKYREKFTNGCDKKFTEEDVNEYCSANSASILNAILTVGLGPVKNKFDRKRYVFDNLNSGIVSIMSQSPELLPLLYAFCRSKDFKKGQPEACNGVFDMFNGLLGLDKQDLIKKLVYPMIRDQHFEPKILQEAYIHGVLETCGINTTQDIQKTMPKFNLKHFNSLIAAYYNFTGSGQETINGRIHKHKYWDILRILIRSVFEDNYHQVINDPDTAYGIANQNTKKIYADHGLDYDKWMNKCKVIKEKSFDLEDGETFRIKIWDRQPGQDLFIGNKSNACTGMIGSKADATIDALINTSVQNIEIINEKENDNSAGKVLVYWAENTNNGQLMLVANSFELPDDYHRCGRNKGDYDPTNVRKNQKIRQEVTDFLKAYAREVSGKDVPIMTPENNENNSFTTVYTDDLNKEDLKIKFIGDAVHYENDKSKSKFCLESLKFEEDWHDIRNAYDVKLCRLDAA